ncbi:hypothetical protein [Microbacterium sp. 18062]|uniref:hypothetical protein n=1 Tax=Microbacterium sp. 18062 TaxID=2681410 RepID=UPI0013592027|nr:hypothetical protein [Microbacterium sp. 18062]
MQRDEHERFLDEVVPRLYMRIPSAGPSSASDVVEFARAASDDTVLRMLATDRWRERKTGAWLAVGRGTPPLADAVLESLRTSQGNLTSPSLATAAITLCGDRAVPSLLEYGRADVANTWYGVGFISAALAHLGEPSPFPHPTEHDVAGFARHLEIAEAVVALRA